MKNNVLVLGDGLLGGELIKQSNWDYVSRSKDGFDINHLDEFILSNYDIVINCISHTDTYDKDRELHWNVNCKFVDKLIDYCNENFIKLIHISTDYVYSNSIPFASENDVPVHCNNWYGYTKLLSDGLIQLRSDDYLLIRCSHKPSPFVYDNAWIDYVGNFDYVDTISTLIIDCVNKDLSGVYNVGTDVKTMFDLANETNVVEPSFTPSHVPNNLSMDLTKLKSSLP
jgi:dTDP-4-dehydrorhamnose reductase|tara:strand:+ start:32 stop:712 length:681 start_codon:yes stop_codon:yes gene_type:complete